MANKPIFDFEWDGLDELIVLFGEISTKWERHIIREMNRFKTVPERGVKALSPRDEGDLESSWVTSSIKKSGASYSFTIGTNLPYAPWLHERDPGMGTYPKYSRGAVIEGYYVNGWGEKTRNKPNWRGFKPGKKFLANAIKGSERDFDKMNTRLLDILTGG